MTLGSLSLSLLCCTLSQLLFQIFCPSIKAQWLKQSSIKMVVLDLARAHSPGEDLQECYEADLTYNAFPRVSLARLYSFPAFIFPNGIGNLQLGPTIIVAHVHQVHGCAANNTTSMGKLQVSKAISRKRNFPLFFCPLRLSFQSSFEGGGRALGQPARNAVSSAALPPAKNKSGNQQ